MLHVIAPFFTALRCHCHYPYVSCGVFAIVIVRKFLYLISVAKHAKIHRSILVTPSAATEFVTSSPGARSPCVQ